MENPPLAFEKENYARKGPCICFGGHRKGGREAEGSIRRKKMTDVQVLSFSVFVGRRDKRGEHPPSEKKK